GLSRGWELGGWTHEPLTPREKKRTELPAVFHMEVEHGRRVRGMDGYQFFKREAYGRYGGRSLHLIRVDSGPASAVGPSPRRISETSRLRRADRFGRQIRRQSHRFHAPRDGGRTRAHDR